jgi:hypothetical protein
VSVCDQQLLWHCDVGLPDALKGSMAQGLIGIAFCLPLSSPAILRLAAPV